MGLEPVDSRYLNAVKFISVAEVTRVRRNQLFFSGCFPLFLSFNKFVIYYRVQLTDML